MVQIMSYDLSELFNDFIYISKECILVMAHVNSYLYRCRFIVSDFQQTCLDQTNTHLHLGGWNLILIKQSLYCQVIYVKGTYILRFGEHLA